MHIVLHVHSAHDHIRTRPCRSKLFFERADDVLGLAKAVLLALEGHVLHLQPFFRTASAIISD